jgi:hypothetical protein
MASLLAHFKLVGAGFLGIVWVIYFVVVLYK